MYKRQDLTCSLIVTVVTQKIKSLTADMLSFISTEAEPMSVYHDFTLLHGAHFFVGSFSDCSSSAACDAVCLDAGNVSDPAENAILGCWDCFPCVTECQAVELTCKCSGRWKSEVLQRGHTIPRKQLVRPLVMLLFDKFSIRQQTPKAPRRQILLSLKARLSSKC